MIEDREKLLLTEDERSLVSAATEYQPRLRWNSIVVIFSLVLGNGVRVVNIQGEGRGDDGRAETVLLIVQDGFLVKLGKIDILFDFFVRGHWKQGEMKVFSAK